MRQTIKDPRDKNKKNTTFINDNFQQKQLKFDKEILN